ncbi:nucleotide sugar dehydrogenase [Streptomyces sp. NPDC050095]|uniref:nucleotide sugar dehydrogenase n=1 Tax=unclassified Streptomyces TaxID=2593676 RepID=UPI00341A47C6
MYANAGSRVTVVGLGYVGLPVAVAAAERGLDVTGVDVDALRVKRLASGDSYVEDIPDERLLAALDSGRLHVSTDPAAAAGFDVAVITVPTPLTDGAPDLSYVEASGRALAPHLRRGATVILESTSYPGTTEDVLRPLLEQGSSLTAGRDFHLGYSPERIDPGNRRWRLENTPKVVSGIDDDSLEAVEAFYDRIVERTVPVSSPRTAELTKLLENTFRHVNIALVNELAMCARPLGVDIWEAVDAAATKPFGFMPFFPGPGVGGHCLPVDPSYLSWQVRRRLQHDVRFVSLANEINAHMPSYVVERAAAGMRRALAGARVLLIGLAYKKDTGDVRESPAVETARLLHEAGAVVHAVEPHADPAHLPTHVLCVELTEAELRASDAVIVLTDHDGLDYALLEAAASYTYVLDTRSRCAARTVERL